MRFLLILTLLFVQACAGPETKPAADHANLTFIHLNDTYRIDALEEGRAGGFARVATIVRNLKAQGRDVRILHGGDFLYPSLESKHFDGAQMVEAMNYLDDLAPLYVVPGNHEFEPEQPDVLIDRVRESRFKWISDNILFRTGQQDVDDMLLNKFTFVAGGKTVGVFGITRRPDSKRDQRDYAVFAQASYVDSAARAIEALRHENADMIIGLTHLSLEQDLEIAALKDRYPEFLLVAGGHEHNVQYHEATDHDALVVKGDSNARRIWQIDVEFRDRGPVVRDKQIDVNDSIPQDPGYADIPARWEERLMQAIPFLKARIGDAAVRLDGRESTIRTRDSGWGMFIADQMQNAFPGKEIDFAIVNSGSLRIDDFIEADITWEDIARTFMYPSAVRFLEIRGRDFRELLETGYRGNAGEGYFPQLSGLRVCVDRGNENGKRIVQLQVSVDGNWQEIDDERVYGVVASDYIVGGGDDYDFSRALHKSPASAELKYLVLDSIMEATSNGQKVGQAISTDGRRYVELGAGEDLCFAQ